MSLLKKTARGVAVLGVAGGLALAGALVAAPAYAAGDFEITSHTEFTVPSGVIYWVDRGGNQQVLIEGTGIAGHTIEADNAASSPGACDVTPAQTVVAEDGTWSLAVQLGFQPAPNQNEICAAEVNVLDTYDPSPAKKVVFIMSEFEITSPAQGEAVVSTNGEVTISGVSSPDYEATIGYPVVIDVTVGSVQGSTTPDADGNWSVTLSGVSNGAHTVHARAHLELGNLATYELGVGTTDFTVVDADAGVPVIAPAIATTTALAGLVGFGVYALRRKQAVHTAR